MVSLSRICLILGLAALGLLAVSPSPLGAQPPKKADAKRVSFKTFDGVELQGTFYPPGGAKKDATVLILHDFDHKSGGNSHQDGWDKLAVRLQNEGFSVLSFDFRGFGESKTIDGATFLKFPQNRPAVKIKGGKAPDSIDQKDFPLGYYRYLVNDIAAAKAYLDQKNDAKEINSGNIIVLGAGQGATLGAMWVASEGRTFREKLPAGGGFVPPPALAVLQNDPESKDIAAAVWLGISPKIGNTPVATSLHSWVKTATADRKIPTAFVYGKNDTAGDNVAKGCIKAASLKGKSEYAIEKVIEETAATGSKLTNNGDTTRVVVKLAAGIMDSRGNPVWSQRDLKNYRFFYQMPTGFKKLSKPAGEEVGSIDVGIFLPR